MRDDDLSIVPFPLVQSGVLPILVLSCYFLLINFTTRKNHLLRFVPSNFHRVDDMCCGTEYNHIAQREIVSGEDRARDWPHRGAFVLMCEGTTYSQLPTLLVGETSFIPREIPKGWELQPQISLPTIFALNSWSTYESTPNSFPLAYI